MTTPITSKPKYHLSKFIGALPGYRVQLMDVKAFQEFHLTTQEHPVLLVSFDAVREYLPLWYVAIFAEFVKELLNPLVKEAYGKGFGPEKGRNWKSDYDEFTDLVEARHDLLGHPLERLETRTIKAIIAKHGSLVDLLLKCADRIEEIANKLAADGHVTLEHPSPSLREVVTIEQIRAVSEAVRPLRVYPQL